MTGGLAPLLTIGTPVQAIPVTVPPRGVMVLVPCV